MYIVCGGWTRRKTKGILRAVSIILQTLLYLNDLFADLDTSATAEDTLDVTEDSELTSGDGADHEQTGTNTTVGATDTELLGDLDETGDSSLTGSALGLVDLGEHGVGGLGDDGGSETSDETGAEVDTGLGAVGEGALVELSVDGLGDLLEDDELGHGVGDPVRTGLAQNRSDIKIPKN